MAVVAEVTLLLLLLRGREPGAGDLVASLEEGRLGEGVGTRELLFLKEKKRGLDKQR